MKRIETVENQTIMDIAIQEYGNRAAVFQIIEDNPDIENEVSGDFSITDDLASQTLNIRTEGDIVKNKVLRKIPNKVTSWNKEV